MKSNPSDFTNKPYSSVLQNSESESVAMNIMRILTRTGNTFRELSYDEYKLERLKDGNFSESERRYFDKVIGYCVSPATARLLSPAWG